MIGKDELGSDAEDRIVSQINKEIGNDAANLARASVLVEFYKDQLHEISNKLNYENSENVSILKSAIQCQRMHSETIEIEMEKLAQFGDKLRSQLETYASTFECIQPDLQEVRRLKRMLQYVRIVQDIQEINESLTAALNNKDDLAMVNVYLTLYEANDSEHSIAGRLSSLEAPAIKDFTLRTAAYWHELLVQRFSDEFEAALKQMRWGHKDKFALQSPSTRDIFKVQQLAEYLFSIKNPIDEADTLITITPSIICQPLSHVTKLLLAPYKQRFLFHFAGTRQTNRLDKPEWFFTQLINWAKESHLFVGEHFQPAAIRAGKVDYNIRLEFIRGLAQLAIEKIVADIDEVCENEHLFAHLLDETLTFEAELRDAFGYPASFPSPLTVVTQPTYLLKWIALEEQFCAEKMDEFLLAENTWQIVEFEISDDLVKIPKCADQFLRLLDAIKDRYYSLIQPGHQLQFLSLQLELIDSFRRRLVQLHSSGTVDSISILNAINYITLVLREWGENVHYLHLHTALVGLNTPEINSVFEQPICEFEHLTEKLVMSLALKAMHEVKAKSMSYRHDTWATMPDHCSKEPYILSPSACEMFQVLVTLLHHLERELTISIFNRVLRLIARQLDDFLLECMIMNTKFSPAGAAQFNYDLTRNLLPLFGQYVRRSELLFKKTTDANKLLNSAIGTAVLLRDLLQSAEPYEDKVKSLKELSIVCLSVKDSVEVLERRTDLKSM